MEPPPATANVLRSPGNRATAAAARTTRRKKLRLSIDSGQETEEGDYVPMDVADWREIPSDALANKELKEALARALASLQPKYREVFVLRDVQGMSIAEAAAVLDITQATVKMRLMRARLQMRDALAPGYDGSWTRGEKHYRPVRSATFY